MGILAEDEMLDTHPHTTNKQRTGKYEEVRHHVRQQGLDVHRFLATGGDLVVDGVEDTFPLGPNGSKRSF